MTISDIVTKIYNDTKTNPASYLAANMLIDINEVYNDIVSIIQNTDGRWQWDDTNQTTESIATTAIVSGQQDYSLATSHQRILRVELKQNGATYFTRLLPIDEADYPNGLDNVNTGVPMYYDLVGGSVFLYPIPNYSQATSLKVYYQRGPAEFTAAEVTTGTKEPGFSSLFHSLIPNIVSYNYWLSSNPVMADRFLQKAERKEAQLVKFYGSRDKDDPAQLTMQCIRFR